MVNLAWAPNVGIATPPPAYRMTNAPEISNGTDATAAQAHTVQMRSPDEDIESQQRRARKSRVPSICVFFLVALVVSLCILGLYDGLRPKNKACKAGHWIVDEDGQKWYKCTENA